MVAMCASVKAMGESDDFEGAVLVLLCARHRFSANARLARLASGDSIAAEE
jgi:hypothetical protein